VTLRSRLANWILACAIAPADRQCILGDLAEEYAIRRGTTSRMSANFWYWTQVLRSIPWLLSGPVRRSGWMATFGVALAACAAQAAVELVTAAFLPGIIQGSARAAVPVALVVVLGSLVVVSCIASRIRPGAGTLLTLMASVAMLVRVFHAGIEGVHLSHILESACAPSAAFVGAALAVNTHRSPNSRSV
jgi:hypothetical protein